MWYFWPFKFQFSVKCLWLCRECEYEVLQAWLVFTSFNSHFSPREQFEWSFAKNVNCYLWQKEANWMQPKTSTEIWCYVLHQKSDRNLLLGKISRANRCYLSFVCAADFPRSLSVSFSVKHSALPVLFSVGCSWVKSHSISWTRYKKLWFLEDNVFKNPCFPPCHRYIGSLSQNLNFWKSVFW